MLWLFAAVGGLGSILKLAVWAFKAYTARQNANFINSERQAGEIASELKAGQDEENRINNAAAAGNSPSGLRNRQTDPNNRDRA